MLRKNSVSKLRNIQFDEQGHFALMPNREFPETKQENSRFQIRNLPKPTRESPDPRPARPFWVKVVNWTPDPGCYV